MRRKRSLDASKYRITRDHWARCGGQRYLGRCGIAWQWPSSLLPCCVSIPLIRKNLVKRYVYSQARYCSSDNLKWESDHPDGPGRDIRGRVELLTWASNVDNLSSLVKACSVS